MSLKHYEAVFILTPVLSEQQMKDTVEKFKTVVTDAGADLYHEENWGLRKLAYPISNKSTGFYQLFEFKAPAEAIAKIETEFKRDETVMRFLTVHLDKYALEFNENRKAGKYKKVEPKKEEAK